MADVSLCRVAVGLLQIADETLIIIEDMCNLLINIMFFL